MASNSSDFDEAITQLERNPVHKAVVRDLRRAYRSLQGAKRLVEDNLKLVEGDLKAEREEHAESIQNLPILQAELDKSKNLAETYRAELAQSQITVSLLAADIKKTRQEKRIAEDKLTPLQNELEKEKKGSAAKDCALRHERECLSALENELKDLRRDQVRSQAQAEEPHGVHAEDVKMQQPDTTGEVKDEAQEHGAQSVEAQTRRASDEFHSRPLTPPGEPADELQPTLPEPDCKDVRPPVVVRREAATGPEDQGIKGPATSALKRPRGVENVELTLRPVPNKRQKTPKYNESFQPCLSSLARNPGRRSIATGSTARNEPRPKKLNVKNLVTGSTPTIWDGKCKVDLPSFKDTDDVEYEMGDIVCVNYDRLCRNSRPFTNSAVLPNARIAVLCDYSTTSPTARNGKITHPFNRRGVKYFAVMWIATKYEMKELFAGKVKNHEHIHHVWEGTRRIFLGEDVPKSQRFLTTEVEWMRITELAGHPDPTDIGTCVNSERSVMVDWTGPVLEVTNYTRSFTTERSKKDRVEVWWNFRLGKKSGLGVEDFPNGWIIE